MTKPPSNDKEAWAKVHARLQAEVGNAIYDSWLKHLDLMMVQNGCVTLEAPTDFFRRWIAAHYSDRLLALWHEANPVINRVEIVTRQRRTQSAAATGVGHTMVLREAAEASQVARTVTKSAPAITGGSGGGEGDGLIDHDMTFDNFVVGSSNEFAHAAARRVAESGSVVFNPLFLYGGSGLGKTHLMHAIANEIRKRFPERRVLYISSESFLLRFVSALRFKNTFAFKQEFRNVDVLMIDDIHFIAGKESTQDEFFHTFNALVDGKRQVVVSADRSPSDLAGMEERLRSRLGGGLVADFDPMDYELRLGILHTKAEEMRSENPLLVFPDEVLEFTARRVAAGGRELVGALGRLKAQAELLGRPLTVEIAQETLRDLLRMTDRRRVSVDQIIRTVCDRYKVRPSDVTSKRRTQDVVRPRHVAMYLAKLLTDRSYPAIAQAFNRLDHSTVIHAFNKIEAMRKIDSALDEDIQVLKRKLEE